MRNLVKQLTNSTTANRLIKESSLEELILLIRWISGDCKEERYVSEWKLARLARERLSYEKKGIPEKAWPSALQGQDWAERAWKELTGEPLPEVLLQKYNYSAWALKYWNPGALEEK